MFSMFMENYLALNSLARVIIFLLVGCPLVTMLRSLLEQIFHGGDASVTHVHGILFGTSLCSTTFFIAAGIPLFALVSAMAIVVTCLILTPFSNINQGDVI